jgi:hypothetical protein
MDKLYNYVFHYNFYNEQWYAIPRELYIHYWQSPDMEGIMKSPYLNALIEEIKNQK